MKPRKQKPLKDYSVLLMYPDYCSEQYGEDTYYDFVRARSPKEAVRIARKRCRDTNDLDLEDLYDLACLLVTDGHNQGLDEEDKS
jgi:uncharacterized hydantoinase/oxoprolinase family protein